MSLSGSSRIPAGELLVSFFFNFRFFKRHRMLWICFLKFWDVFQDKAATIFGSMTNTICIFLVFLLCFMCLAKASFCISISFKQFKNLLSLSEIFDSHFVVKIMKVTFFWRSNNVYLKSKIHIICIYNQ